MCREAEQTREEMRPTLDDSEAVALLSLSTLKGNLLTPSTYETGRLSRASDSSRAVTLGASQSGPSSCRALPEVGEQLWGGVDFILQLQCAQVQSLRQALEHSQDAQRRLQHSNQVLQEMHILAVSIVIARSTSRYT